MSKSMPPTADDVIAELAEWLIGYRQRAARIVNEAATDQVAPDSGARVEPEQPQLAFTELAGPAPWEALIDDPTKERATSMKMSPTLYAKMQWVTNNVPKMSFQKLIQAGAEAEADRLIALYHNK